MLNVLARLRVPVIAVLHTVLSAPTPGQRRVLETVVEHAGAVVTMSEAAKSCAGQSHPKVLAQEGESYRTDLRDRAAARGVADLLEFDPTYLDAEELAHLVAWADVVLAPLRLLRAGHVGCAGRGARGVPPRCRHGVPAAVELLASGADLLVPHRDPAAIAAALRRVLTEPGLS